jgi:hypothetical protein
MQMEYEIGSVNRTKPGACLWVPALFARISTPSDTDGFRLKHGKI